MLGALWLGIAERSGLRPDRANGGYPVLRMDASCLPGSGTLPREFEVGPSETRGLSRT